jgi:succinyl-CoA:acetate CoA-transferase
MTDRSRLRCKATADKVMSAQEAAAFIAPGNHVGMSGFTGFGHPKAVPAALVRGVTDAAARGDRFAVSVWTGSSTAPERDGALAAVDGIDLGMPYQSDPVSRAKINAGRLDYLDVHLSHVAQMVEEGLFGHLDVALVEVTGITADGALIPSSSVGNNDAWINAADRVILEVNSWQAAELEGMHDICPRVPLPPDRKPIQILRPSDRIGVPYLHFPPEKIIAVVPTDSPDYATPSRPSDRDSQEIAGHVLDFLAHEVRRGRLPATLPPLQSGVGNVTNAVLAGLGSGPFPPTDRVHRGDPGQHAATAGLGHDDRGLGDRLLPQPGRYRRPARQYRGVPRPDHPAPAGDQQPPGGHPPAGLPGDERHDRSRHLRQRQRHPHHGLEHVQRHRRIR